MSKKQLINYFEKFLPLNDIEEMELINRSSERLVKRKHLLLQESDVCNHLTFVVKGCFRMYKTDKNGKEHNLQFVAENDWITDMSSLHKRKPSLVNIEAIETSVIIQIERKDLWHLYTHYHTFDRNFRVMIEEKFIELQDRVLQNMSFSCQERYKSFIQQYPDLAQRMPNTQIASFLGVTPEFLCKIRSEKQIPVLV